MADFLATEVALSGFRFAREHPRTIAIWAAVYLVVSAVGALAVVAAFGPALTELQAARASADLPTALAAVRRLAPLYLLAPAWSLVVYAVLNAAVARATLRPGEHAPAYLGLGMDEVRQGLLMLLSLAVALGLYLAMVLAMVVVGLVTARLGRPTTTAALLVTLLAGLGAMVFVWVRLSLAWPMTFDRRRVILFESWRLTRGRFWKLFGTYLLVLGLAMVVGLMLLVISAAVAAVVGGLKAMGQITRPDMSSLGAYFTPARLALMLVWAGGAALIWPVVLLPPPEIYKRLAQG